MQKKIIDFVGVVLLLVLIFSMPRIMRCNSLKKGSTIVKATIVDKVSCNRNRSKCWQYVYVYKEKTYNGEFYVDNRMSIGQEIEVEISLNNPSTSFVKK